VARPKRFSLPFYPAYINGYAHYKTVYSHNIVAYEEWLVEQKAQFHKRAPDMKQNRKFYFNDEQDMLIFAMRWA
jgi:hypothetical protein